MNATTVMTRIRKAARKRSLTVDVTKPRRGSHHKVIVGGHCKPTESMHPGDLPTGTLNRIGTDLEHCFGAGWLR